MNRAEGFPHGQAGVAALGSGEAVASLRPPNQVGLAANAGAAFTPRRSDVSSLAAVAANSAGAAVPAVLSEWPTTIEVAQRLARVEGLLLGLANVITAALGQPLAPHPALAAGAATLRRPASAPRGESTEAEQARGGAAPALRRHKGNPKPKKWSTERKALLVKMKTARVPAPLILAALNKLRGDAITLQAMHSYANAYGLRTKGPAPRLQKVWNEARDAHLRMAWARGDTKEQIFADLNAIEGMAPITRAGAVFNRAHKLKLTRSVEGMRLSRERMAEKVRGVGLVWNEAMNAMLREHYPNKGKPLADLAAEISAIAPRPISIDAVQQRAHNLRVVRPAGPAIGTVIKPRKTPAAPTPPRRASAPKVSASPLPAAPAASVSAKGDDCAQPKPVADGAPPAKNLSEGKLGPGGARVEIIAAPQVDGEPPPYDPTAKGAVETRVAKAREMLRKGTDEHIVQMQTRIGLREVYRLAGEIHRERAA